jgi:hypothetical protein
MNDIPVTPTHSIVQVLHEAEFQHLLRTLGANIEHCIVSTPSALNPELVKVEGALSIHGEPHFWSTECDLRGITSADDIIQFIGMLERSFEKAAAQIGRPA